MQSELDKLVWKNVVSSRTFPAAEEYCQEKANLHTGFWAFNNAWYIYDNFRAREEYRKCLIETGWIAEGQTQAQK